KSVLLRQSLPQILPGRAGVARTPNSGFCVRHIAAGDVAVERQKVERVRITRMRRGREPKARRQPVLDAHPASTAVITAIHSAVVLLVQPVWLAGRHDHAMHALSVFGVSLILRQVVTPYALIARLPRLAAIFSVERASRRNGDPHLLFVGGMENNGMEDQAAATRLPVRPRGVIAEPHNVLPCLAAIIAAEEARRFDTGIKHPIFRRGETPTRLDRLLTFCISQTLARMSPRLAEVS